MEFSIKTSIKPKQPATDSEMNVRLTVANAKEKELMEGMKDLEEDFHFRQSVHQNLDQVKDVSIDRMKNFGKIELQPVNPYQ